MKTTSIIMVLTMIGCSGCPALSRSADNHYKLMEVYTHIAAAAFFAENNCPGLKANKTSLIILRSSAAISDDEEPMIEDSLKSIAFEIKKQYVSSGQLSWCSSAFESFGPQGKLVKGILYR